MVSGQSFGSSAVSHACITSMCSVQHFPGSHSSFGLWIILLPSDCRCFLLFGKAIFFLRCLWLRSAFVQSLFLRNLGRKSWRDVRLCVWPWFLLGCLIRNFMVPKFDNSLAAVFSRDGTTVVLCSHA